MYKDFIAYINQFHPVNEELSSQITQYLTRVTFSKKYTVVQESTLCNYVYFLEKGLMRAYYAKNNSEITTWILHERQLVTSIQSFYARTPSEEIIETLEPCTVVMMHYDDIMRLCEQSHEFTFCLLKMSHHYNVLRDMRNCVLRTLSALKRYEVLCEQDPELVHRASSKVIASYLDISQETLSRIRKQIKDRKQDRLSTEKEIVGE